MSNTTTSQSQNTHIPKVKGRVQPYSEKRFPWQHPPVGPKLSFYLALRGIKRKQKRKKEREGKGGGRRAKGKESVRMLEAKLCAVRDMQTNISSHAG